MAVVGSPADLGLPYEDVVLSAADGVVPSALMDLLRDLPWCDETKKWVDLGSPGRVALIPWV